MLLSDAKANLYSCVAAPIDDEDRDSKWLRYFNQAASRIYMSGKWKGTVRTIEVTVGSDGFIELPTTYEAVLAVRNPNNAVVELVPEAVEWGIRGNYIGPIGSEGGAVVGIIDRGDGRPVARRYRVPTGIAAPLETMTLRVKLAAPIFGYDDDEEVIPPNLGAWKLALYGLMYEDENDIERADSYWNRCFNLLNQELKQFRGNQRAVMNLHPWGMGFSGRIQQMY